MIEEAEGSPFECSYFIRVTIPKIIILGIVNTFKNTPGPLPCVFGTSRDICKVLEILSWLINCELLLYRYALFNYIYYLLSLYLYLITDPSVVLILTV